VPVTLNVLSKAAKSTSTFTVLLTLAPAGTKIGTR